MFSAGTRVYVYASSITGKKMGPKRHSIGYVSGNLQTYLINYIKEFPIKNQSFAITPLTIVFTRYGKEQKHRIETRNFINITPAFTNAKGLVIQKRVADVLDHFVSGEMSKNSYWTDMIMNYGSLSRYSAGVILPIVDQVIKLEGHESKAWVMSILKNDVFKNLLIINKKLSTLVKQTDDYELVKWVSNAVRNSDTLSSLMDWSEENSSNMDRLITLLRILTATFNKRIADSSFEFMGKRLKKGGIDINAFMTWYLDGLFENKSLATKKHKIATPENVGGTLATLADSMTLVRTSYLNLKLKHI